MLTFVKVLASFLLDYIEDQTMDQHSKIVTYFFCDDKDNSRNSAESILRGLVHQLIKTTPDLIKHAMRYYQTDGSRLVDSFGTLWDVLLAIVTDPRVSNTYVVLDALDEYKERSRN
jgi:hypothetical protein